MSPSLSRKTIKVTERRKMTKNDENAGKSAEKGKLVPLGFETKGKISVATGSGVTGRPAVNVVADSGTKATGHDLPSLFVVVEMSKKDA